VRHAVPVEHLLLLLRPDTVVLVQVIQECALGFLQCCIGSGLEVPQIGEDTLLKLFRVLDWTSEGLESECETSDNIGTGDVEQVAPIEMVSYSLSPITLSGKTNQRTQET
jgi:hypothetical protein